MSIDRVLWMFISHCGFPFKGFLNRVLHAWCLFDQSLSIISLVALANAVRMHNLVAEAGTRSTDNYPLNLSIQLTFAWSHFFFAPDARIPAGRSNNETGGAVPGHWRNANWDQSSHGTYLFMCCIWKRMCFASCLTDDMPNTQRKRLVHCIDVLLVDCWVNVYGSKSQSYCVAKRTTIKRRPGTALIGSWMCISLLTVI